MHNIMTTLLAVTTLAIAGTAAADDYPVTGTWTYSNPSDSGAAQNCSGQTMTFGNGTRHDTVGSVPELKNKSATQTGAGQYQMVDTFFNGQTWGSVRYSMHVVDPDHVQINYDKGGSYTLRRCQ
jgi:ABC-type glycerol-3-phosphate transport system substrate-binding protein